MRRSICLFLGSLSLIIIFVSFGMAYAGNKKVTICHYPPGNKNNAHTITVSENALPAHLAHGDSLGECPTGCQADESICDDGDLCTSDNCLPNGECENLPVDCEDGNPCTSDLCDEAIGCLNPPANGVPCNDGNACTEGDICIDTACLGQPITDCCVSDLECDDSDPCTFDSCVDNSCQNEPKDCTVTDQCSVGFCDQASGECLTAPVSCDDSNACTDDFCDPQTGCSSVPFCEGTTDSCGCAACVDCSASDRWYDVGGTYACCDGASACATCQDQEFRTFTCSGTECSYTVTGTRTLKEDCTSCGDGDTCDNGVCVGAAPPDGTPCDDSDACTQNEVYLGGVCQGGQPVSCDDSNFCTDDFCDSATGCYSLPTSDPPEDYEISCSDGLDNDCDGLVDCNDLDYCISVCCSEDPFEPNDSPELALELPFSDGSAQINPLGDLDWFSFEVSLVGRLYIGTSALPGGGAIQIALFDGEGNIIAAGLETLEVAGISPAVYLIRLTSDQITCYDFYVSMQSEPANPAILQIAVDDSANKTYQPDQLQWKGSFNYDATTNSISFDPTWRGPWVPLYDNGPISQGGNEAAGQIAGDNIWSTEVFFLADPATDIAMEYGIIDENEGWIWPGPNGLVTVPAGYTGRIEAPGLVIQPFGEFDFRLVLNANELHPGFELPSPTIETVSVKVSSNGWQEISLTNHGGGIYEFVWSDHFGPHDGLLNEGDVVQFVFVIDGVEYKNGGVALEDGVSAYTDYPTPGNFVPEVIFVSPEGLTAFLIGPE